MFQLKKKKNKLGRAFFMKVFGTRMFLYRI